MNEVSTEVEKQINKHTCPPPLEGEELYYKKAASLL